MMYREQRFFRHSIFSKKSHLSGNKRNIGHSCKKYFQIILTQTCPCVDGITVLKLGEEKYASVSQGGGELGKRNMLRYGRHTI